MPSDSELVKIDTTVSESVREITSAPEESLFGAWKLVVQIDKEWFLVNGCGEYGVNISSEEMTGAESEISMSDRMGLSILLHFKIENLQINSNNVFEISGNNSLIDELITINGRLIQSHDTWQAPILVLDKKSAEIFLREVPEPVEKLHLLKSTPKTILPARKLEYDCDLGFEENDEALLQRKLEKLVKRIQKSSEVTEPEMAFHYSIFPIDSNMLVVQDSQHGDHSTLDFFLINADSVLLDSRSYSGVFAWLENHKKFELQANNTIVCYPGAWKFNEQEQFMELVTRGVQIKVESGKLVEN